MNWGQIKTAVRQYLENEESTFLTNFTLYARLAEEDIYRKLQLQFTKETATTALLVNDRLLSLPVDAVSLYSLAIIDPVSGDMNLLLPKDEAFLKEAYPNPTQVGAPRFYAYRDELNLLLAPAADAAYGVEMHYHSKPVSIGANDIDANNNWLSQNAESALIFGIILHGYIYEKGDQDVIASYTKQFETALADLKLIAEGRQRKDTYRTPDQRIPT